MDGPPDDGQGNIVHGSFDKVESMNQGSDDCVGEGVVDQLLLLPEDGGIVQDSAGVQYVTLVQDGQTYGIPLSQYESVVGDRSGQLLAGTGGDPSMATHHYSAGAFIHCNDNQLVAITTPHSEGVESEQMTSRQSIIHTPNISLTSTDTTCLSPPVIAHLVPPRDSLGVSPVSSSPSGHHLTSSVVNLAVSSAAVSHALPPSSVGLPLSSAAVGHLVPSLQLPISAPASSGGQHLAAHHVSLPASSLSTSGCNMPTENSGAVLVVNPTANVGESQTSNSGRLATIAGSGGQVEDAVAFSNSSDSSGLAASVMSSVSQEGQQTPTTNVVFTSARCSKNPVPLKGDSKSSIGAANQKVATGNSTLTVSKQQMVLKSLRQPLQQSPQVKSASRVKGVESRLQPIRVDNWGIFLLTQLHNFFQRKRECDLTIRFPECNAQIKVHKLVMNACTEFFVDAEKAGHLVGDPSYIDLPSTFLPDAVAPIIRFMYTGRLDVRGDTFDKLYKTAHLLKMNVLIKLLDTQLNSSTKSECRKRRAAGMESDQLTQIRKIRKIEQQVKMAEKLRKQHMTLKKKQEDEEMEKKNTLPGKKLPIWKKRVGSTPTDSRVSTKGSQDSQSEVSSAAAAALIPHPAPAFPYRILRKTPEKAGVESRQADPETENSASPTNEAKTSSPQRPLITNTYQRRKGGPSSRPKIPRQLREIQEHLMFEKILRTGTKNQVLAKQQEKLKQPAEDMDRTDDLQHLELSNDDIKALSAEQAQRRAVEQEKSQQKVEGIESQSQADYLDDDMDDYYDNDAHYITDEYLGEEDEDEDEADDVGGVDRAASTPPPTPIEPITTSPAVKSGHPAVTTTASIEAAAISTEHQFAIPNGTPALDRDHDVNQRRSCSVIVAQKSHVQPSNMPTEGRPDDRMAAASPAERSASGSSGLTGSCHGNKFDDGAPEERDNRDETITKPMEATDTAHATQPESLPPAISLTTAGLAPATALISLSSTSATTPTTVTITLASVSASPPAVLTSSGMTFSSPSARGLTTASASSMTQVVSTRRVTQAAALATTNPTRNMIRFSLQADPSTSDDPNSRTTRSSEKQLTSQRTDAKKSIQMELDEALEEFSRVAEKEAEEMERQEQEANTEADPPATRLEQSAAATMEQVSPDARKPRRGRPPKQSPTAASAQPSRPTQPSPAKMTRAQAVRTRAVVSEKENQQQALVAANQQEAQDKQSPSHEAPKVIAVNEPKPDQRPAAAGAGPQQDQARMIAELLKKYPKLQHSTKPVKIKLCVKDPTGKMVTQVITIKPQNVKSTAAGSAEPNGANATPSSNNDAKVTSGPKPGLTDSNYSLGGRKLIGLFPSLTDKFITTVKPVDKVHYSGKRGRPKKVKTGDFDPHEEERRKIRENLEIRYPQIANQIKKKEEAHLNAINTGKATEAEPDRAQGVPVFVNLERGESLKPQVSGLNSQEAISSPRPDQQGNNAALSSMDPSSEAESFSNVASGIAASLGLGQQQVAQQISNDTYIIPDILPFSGPAIIVDGNSMTQVQFVQQGQEVFQIIQPEKSVGEERRGVNSQEFYQMVPTESVHYVTSATPQDTRIAYAPISLSVVPSAATSVIVESGSANVSYCSSQQVGSGSQGSEDSIGIDQQQAMIREDQIVKEEYSRPQNHSSTTVQYSTPQMIKKIEEDWDSDDE